MRGFGPWVLRPFGGSGGRAPRRRLLPCLAVVGLLVNPAAFAAGISASGQYAWSENAGWLNFNATNGNVQVYPDHLEGFVWAENLGWIRLGSHSGGGAYTYANTSNTTYGVNHDGHGQLSGYAWSENAGWIHFQGVTIDANGLFDGHAWGENVGYIHFRNASPAYQVAVNRDPQTITHFNAPTTGVVGGSATLSATGGGSGNPVVFGATTPAICAVNGATVSYGAIGTCTVTANQAGGPLYLSASISRDIIIEPNSLGDPTAIPTLSEWALGLMSLLLGVSVRRLRRREPF